MLRSVSTLARVNTRTLTRRCNVPKFALKAKAANYHCCIVGSGPAALYTAEEIKKIISHDAKIDFYERLPTPFGLVRYGVAPGKLPLNIFYLHGQFHYKLLYVVI